MGCATLKSSVLVIGLRFSLETLTLFPPKANSEDLIKVKIALDNGQVIGIETTGYLNSHYERNIPSKKISIEEARKQISNKAQISSEGLAMIPTEWKTEKYCYEFKGKIEDIDFIAYINAETGEEEDILIVTNTEIGNLTE